MRTRYTYLGESAIEVVIDGEEVAVNILPAMAAEAPERPMEALPEEDATPTPLPLGAAPVGAPGYSRKQRSAMGAIRAGWTVVFSAAGESVSYIVDNLTGLNLPPGVGTLVGAGLYGAKRALWPDTRL